MVADVDKWRKACNISGQALELGVSLIKKGTPVIEVCDAVDNFIIKSGAKPAFPAQISCNHLAAHYCPDDEDKTVFSDQLVCLDVGVHVDGFIGDRLRVKYTTTGTYAGSTTVRIDAVGTCKIKPTV